MNSVENRPAGINLAFAGGMSAILAYLTGTLLSWWFYPTHFTPLRNWLSDLGNHARNPSGAFFYNVGCVLTAFALLVFMLGLGQWRSGTLGRNALIASSQLTGFASVVSLAGLGLYSEDRMHQHMIYSNWFFASFPLFIVLLSGGLIKHPRFGKSLGVLGFAVVLLGLAFHVAFPRSRPLEWVTEFGFLLYVGCLAVSTRVPNRAAVEP